MNRNPGMNRFFVEAVHMYGPIPGRRQWSYRVRDKDSCVPHFGAKTVATTKDPEIADRIAATLEAGDTRFSAIAWQGCLDRANQNAVEARKSADILSKQLFEAREQRDEARDALKVSAAGEVNMRLEAARALTELAALRKQRDSHVCSPPVYGPLSRVVVLSIEQYDKLVKERDEAIAKYEACVDTVSFVDGRWVKTV
jgi:hypothetical protein